MKGTSVMKGIKEDWKEGAQGTEDTKEGGTEGTKGPEKRRKVVDGR